MYTGTMYSVLCSTVSRLIRPFASCCSCTRVKEAEWDEVDCQARAGRQAPSCQRNLELPPQTAGAASGYAAEAEPKPFVPTSTNNLVPPKEGNEEPPGSSKPASRTDIAEGFLGPRFAPVAEPTTPLQLTPVASRGLSQTTLDPQDNQTGSVTSTGVSSEPAIEPVPCLPLSSICVENDSSTAAELVPSLEHSVVVSGKSSSTAASEPVLFLAPSGADSGSSISSSTAASEPVLSLALSGLNSGNSSSTDNGNSSSTAAEPVKSPALSSFKSSDSDSDRKSATSSTSSSSSSSVSNSRLSYGVATATNNRPHQEDRASAEIFNCSEHALGYNRLGAAAVFDGHGGSEASEYLQQHFVPLLMQQLQLGANPQEATAAAAQQVETHLMSSKCIAGSTLTAAVVVDDQLIMAQVGDSRAVLCGGGGKVVQLTTDHKPTDAGERERIATADPAAEISSDGYCYGMGVSRGLGSYQLKSDGSKKAFIAAVDITVHQLQAEDAFIVLGSDGLYDSLQNQEVVTTARRVLAGAHGDCTGAAQSLVDRAIKMGSSDNVTAVVMLLHDRKIQLAKSNSRLFRNKD